MFATRRQDLFSNADKYLPSFGNVKSIYGMNLFITNVSETTQKFKLHQENKICMECRYVTLLKFCEKLLPHTKIH